MLIAYNRAITAVGVAAGDVTDNTQSAGDVKIRGHVTLDTPPCR